MIRIRPWFVALAVGYGLFAAARVLQGPGPRVDLGRWKVVVLQSDDWGLEGWFPNRAAAGSLVDLVESVPPRLESYRTSSLETAADIDSLAALLLGVRDTDGLPPVLQANTVPAGVSLDVVPGGESWPVHPSGEGSGSYLRPGLAAAVDRAISAGVWHPELHGYTHFDLPAYADARRRNDPLAARALSHGTLAFEGWLRSDELGDFDLEAARGLHGRAQALFRRRFGRDSASVIAPNYVWGSDDEVAWEELGIRVVQAKREQIDPRVNPVGWWGRVRKVLARRIDMLKRSALYLPRDVHLEPYGCAEPECPQGALEAIRDVEAAWRRGRPAIVSIHRVQLVNLEEAVARAGRLQLRLFLQEARKRGARFLVDDEVHQLWRSGVSVVERGPWVVERNFRGAPVALGAGRLLSPETRVRAREATEPVDGAHAGVPLGPR